MRNLLGLDFPLGSSGLLPFLLPFRLSLLSPGFVFVFVFVFVLVIVFFVFVFFVLVFILSLFSPSFALSLLLKSAPFPATIRLPELVLAERGRPGGKCFLNFDSFGILRKLEIFSGRMQTCPWFSNIDHRCIIPLTPIYKVATISTKKKAARRIRALASLVLVLPVLRKVRRVRLLFSQGGGRN